MVNILLPPPAHSSYLFRTILLLILPNGVFLLTARDGSLHGRTDKGSEECKFSASS